MKGSRWMMSACATVALAAANCAGAADVQQERGEIHKMCQDALATLYKEQPDVKAQIAKSAGYGCFSSFGFTFLLGGAGGRGLVHNNATNKDTYMSMGQASVGVEVALKEYREVLVFKDRSTLEQFVESGWEFSAGGGASAEVKGKGGAAEQAGAANEKIAIYPLTRTGVALGGSAAGRKYWKDKSLN